MSEEDKIKKEQAGGESGGEKEQAKSKIDKIEKILGAKIVCACPRCVRGQGNTQKRATLACHSECLHNGIILIVYILQICWCKGSAFCLNNKIFSHKFADFMHF